MPGMPRQSVPLDARLQALAVQHQPSQNRFPVACAFSPFQQILVDGSANTYSAHAATAALVSLPLLTWPLLCVCGHLRRLAAAGWGCLCRAAWFRLLAN